MITVLLATFSFEDLGFDLIAPTGGFEIVEDVELLLDAIDFALLGTCHQTRDIKLTIGSVPEVFLGTPNSG